MTAELRVDLDAFAQNLAVIRDRVSPAAHMLVVKDDAYGHGLDAIVTRARDEGVHWFGAFDVRTGTAVRAAVGEDAGIFVWIVATADEAQAAVDAGLDVGVGDEALLEDLAASTGLARVHLKIDTGLHRNGVRPEEWAGFVARAAELERAGSIEVVGIWSHIAEASDAEDDLARAAFDTAVQQARDAGLQPRLLHLAASAAGFARPEFRYDLVRIGAFAYGIRPAGGPGEAELGIHPISALVARVSTAGDETVSVDAGSLDGLPSTLAGRIDVGTVEGPRALRSIGVDDSVVEAWETAQPGDEVLIFGAGAPVSATDAAERIGTIGEEIALRVAPGIPRVYRGR
ncbi:alanine racemase [Microbacterium sp. AZCO]|uniref:alanine racemase n=1 Tax=Microbacterium sp. AZCO TaxID=3142976 RepID=UPI0031F34DC2